MTKINLNQQSKRKRGWARRPSISGDNEQSLIETIKQYQNDLDNTLEKKYPDKLSQEEWGRLINFSKYYLLSKKRHPGNDDEALLIEYSKKSINFIISYYNNWIMSQVKKFPDSNVYTRDDLYQEACIGLMRAIELYNPSCGVTLITYATRWINALVRAFVHTNSSPFSLKRDTLWQIQSGRETRQIPGVVEIEANERGEENLVWDDRSNLDDSIVMDTINKYRSDYPYISANTLKSWVDQIRNGKVSEAEGQHDPALQAFIKAFQPWIVRR